MDAKFKAMASRLTDVPHDEDLDNTSALIGLIDAPDLPLPEAVEHARPASGLGSAAEQALLYTARKVIIPG